MGGCCTCMDPVFKALGCSCVRVSKAEGSTSINKNRTCTDIPWCLIFLGAIGALGYFWLIAFDEGDLDLLIKPVDYKGTPCGTGDMKDKKYGYWPDVNSLRFKMCTDDCSATLLNNGITGPFDMAKNTITGTNGYPSAAWRDYCLPGASNSTSLEVKGLDDATEQFHRQIEDLSDALPIIGASAGIAIVFGFMFTYLMRACLKSIVYTGCAMIIFGGGFGAYTLFMNAQDIADEDTKNLQQIAAGIIGGVTLLFLIMIVCLRTQMLIAIEVIKSAGRAMVDIPLLIFTPFFGQFLTIAVVIPWVIATGFMFSQADAEIAGTPDSLLNLETSALTQNTKNSYGENFPAVYARLDFDSAVDNIFWFHFFMLLWLLQFFTYWLYLIVSGVISDWYFSRREQNGKKARGTGDDELSKRPILGAFCRSLYHLGSIALAAMIIAIVQTARWMLRYLEKQLQGENKFKKFLLKALDCILCCVECCLDKINKKAIIYIAITGSPLCPAFCKSFTLIWVNMARCAVMGAFTAVIIFVGKVAICLLSTGVSVLILMQVNDDEGETSLILPAIVMLILTWVMASTFMTVYETAVDTVFMCFLLDEEWNKKNPTARMFADDNLRKIVDKYAEQSKEIASQTKGAVKVEPKSDYDAKKEGIKI